MSARPPSRWPLAAVAALISLGVPGTGQLLRGRVGDGLLFLTLAFWLRVVLVGASWQQGVRELMPAVFGFGGLAPLDPGQRPPVVVVFTATLVVVHLWSAYDAWRNLRGSRRDEAPSEEGASPSE